MGSHTTGEGVVCPWPLNCPGIGTRRPTGKTNAALGPVCERSGKGTCVHPVVLGARTLLLSPVLRGPEYCRLPGSED